MKKMMKKKNIWNSISHRYSCLSIRLKGRSINQSIGMKTKRIKTRIIMNFNNNKMMNKNIMKDIVINGQNNRWKFKNI